MDTFSSFGVTSEVLEDENSIFEAYEKGFNVIKKKAKQEDIVILCHDDIEIMSNEDKFKEYLKLAQDPNVGFVGVAGIETLHPTCVWWNTDYLKAGLGRGRVWHHDEKDAIVYGPYGEAVVMDGLFLATTVNKLDLINLKKPKSFKGNWDFYDLLYCHRMNKLGKINVVAPIEIRHHSSGELQGRDGWTENRIAFAANITHKDLKIRGPLGIIR